jgi:hypothetical protein
MVRRDAAEAVRRRPSRARLRPPGSTCGAAGAGLSRRPRSSDTCGIAGAGGGTRCGSRSAVASIEGPVSARANRRSDGAHLGRGSGSCRAGRPGAGFRRPGSTCSCVWRGLFAKIDKEARQTPIRLFGYLFLALLVNRRLAGLNLGGTGRFVAAPARTRAGAAGAADSGRSGRSGAVIRPKAPQFDEEGCRARSAPPLSSVAGQLEATAGPGREERGPSEGRAFPAAAPAPAGPMVCPARSTSLRAPDLDGASLRPLGRFGPLVSCSCPRFRVSHKLLVNECMRFMRFPYGDSSDSVISPSFHWPALVPHRARQQADKT